MNEIRGGEGKANAWRAERAHFEMESKMGTQNNNPLQVSHRIATVVPSPFCSI